MAVKNKSTKKVITTAHPKTLHQLLIVKLQVLHDVENQLIKALPKMAKAATDPALKDAFESHLEETKTHEQRIDEALELAGDERKHKMQSAAIRGLIDDAGWVIKNVKDIKARDANLITAAQYVEHYETAGYGSALAWAKEMGHEKIANLLEKTLAEEKAADNKLTKLAEGGINKKVDSGMGK